MSPFQALLGYNPNFQLRTEDSIVEREAPAAVDRCQKLSQLREKLMDSWRKATESTSNHYNKRHTQKSFNKGQLVALSTRNLRLKGDKNKKLSPRFIGPFRILEVIGKQAYRLLLPEKYSTIHNVFPVQLLEEWHDRIGAESLPMPDLEEDDEWEVEEIRDDRKFEGILHYLIKWTGWPTEYNQWVPEDAMKNAPKIIAKYKREQAKKGPKAKGI
jgi:hypothetical protein